LPLQLLLVLLESPNEVVSKETLRNRLWSDRIFGELDNGLHVAAAKLREALGEKANAARYIETVRGRGYRFNGKVEPVSNSASATTTDFVVSDAGAALDTAPSGSSEVPGRQEPIQAEVRGRLHSRRIGALLLLFVATAGALFFYRHQRRPLVSGSDEVVLGGFTNESSDGSYNGLGRIDIYTLRRPVLAAEVEL
jgi:DNA-binding winged helix-turn-helix (wHTH) protein